MTDEFPPDLIEALVEALRQFADPKNWNDEIANLQWTGKRHAIEFAESVLKAAGEEVSHERQAPTRYDPHQR